MGTVPSPCGHWSTALQSTGPQLLIPLSCDFMPFRPRSPFPATSRQMLLAQGRTVQAQGLLLLARWLQMVPAWRGEPGPAHVTRIHIMNTTTLLLSRAGNVTRA